MSAECPAMTVIQLSVMRIAHLQAFQTRNNWLNWHGHIRNSNQSENDWEVENGSNVGNDNSIEDSESPEQWDVSAAPYVHRLVWLIQISRIQAE